MLIGGHILATGVGAMLLIALPQRMTFLLHLWDVADVGPYYEYNTSNRLGE